LLLILYHSTDYITLIAKFVFAIEG